VKSLRELPKDRLAKLDESLTYHWSIYSPIWAKEGDGWPGVRPEATAEPKTVPSPIPNPVTMYLERYTATDKGLWKLAGGEAATGVSHARKPAEAGKNRTERQ